MSNDLPIINPEKEKKRIVNFLKETFTSQNISYAVIGISGGIDSATSFSLLRESVNPDKIIVAHLYYFKSLFSEMDIVVKNAKIPQKNIYHISIKEPVDALIKLQNIDNTKENEVRIGNIAARIRMIVVYDLAKKYNGLVCGTENKTENLLGYFTRFGDQASDLEPIEHLYKTQVLQLAEFLKLPQTVINQKPSAGLWVGQTDEGQFGFTYEEADSVLYLHLVKKLNIEKIEKKGFRNVNKILSWRQQNLFKHLTPYTLHK
jgi:NAD+ synthase